MRGAVTTGAAYAAIVGIVAWVLSGWSTRAAYGAAALAAAVPYAAALPRRRAMAAGALAVLAVLAWYNKPWAAVGAEKRIAVLATDTTVRAGVYKGTVAPRVQVAKFGSAHVNLDVTVSLAQPAPPGSTVELNGVFVATNDNLPFALNGTLAKRVGTFTFKATLERASNGSMKLVKDGAPFTINGASATLGYTDRGEVTIAVDEMLFAEFSATVAAFDATLERSGAS